LQTVGEGRCPIVDTWWQTETGAAMITPLPGAWPCVPGSATLPFFGVLPVILDDKVRHLLVDDRALWCSDVIVLAGNLLQEFCMHDRGGFLQESRALSSPAIRQWLCWLTKVWCV
jgi:hypothetical protein